MASPTACPKCHALQARRVRQEGLVQKLILQKLGFYPWECRFCKATFVLRNRGHRRSDRTGQPRRPNDHEGMRNRSLAAD